MQVDRIVVSLSFLLLANVTHADDALLTWSPVAGAAGYRIYARAGSAPYGAPTDVGLPTASPDGRIRRVSSALVRGQVNHFAVSAYDAGGLDGALSNEISVVAPDPTSTFTPTPTRTFTPTWTPTRTFTRTPTRTPTLPEGCMMVAGALACVGDSSPTPTRTPTFTSTPTFTPTRGKKKVRGYVREYSSGQPMASVQVALQGSEVAASVETDGSGEYAFEAPEGTTLRIEPRHAAPVLGQVTSLDAAYVLQSVLGMRELTAEQRMACDVTGNGALSSLDAALILRHRVGALPQFPVARTCDSDWAFLPTVLPSPNQSVLAPSTSDECRMGSIVIDPLTAPVADRDFVALHFGDCTQGLETTGAASQIASPVERVARTRWARRDMRRRATLVLEVESPEPVYAIDAEMVFDGNRYHARRVRLPGRQRHTLITFKRGAVPGLAGLSLASARPLATNRSGKVSLEVLFDQLDAPRGGAAILWQLRVNGRPVSVVGDAS